MQRVYKIWQLSKNNNIFDKPHQQQKMREKKVKFAGKMKNIYKSATMIVSFKI
jgi:hypothetical protein